MMPLKVYTLHILHDLVFFFSCRSGGEVFVRGREQGYGLAVQEPWIQHATVQDNILFGRDFDSTFYQAVIEACALADDLNVGVYLAVLACRLSHKLLV